MRYNSHSITFTILKCTNNAMVFSIFTTFYNHQHLFWNIPLTPKRNFVPNSKQENPNSLDCQYSSNLDEFAYSAHFIERDSYNKWPFVIQFLTCCFKGSFVYITAYFNLFLDCILFQLYRHTSIAEYQFRTERSSGQISHNTEKIFRD